MIRAAVTAVTLVAALVSGAPPAAHSSEIAMDAGTLAHTLDRVASTARVLYVAAHPDDENTRLLAYLANGRHVTAAYLSMTRGGGGQNLIGVEQAELLDVIRTEELLAARRLDGATQRFTRMRDFGFSKSAAETLAVWGHDEALADVVWVIRSFQPDVVVTRFDEQPPNHGHHTASAILAREAFTAAADPARFPEQLRNGVRPWQATRLLWNVSTWTDKPPPADALPLDVGVYDARLGLGYGELAALSRSQHKSQGFGVPGERGVLTERFVTVAGSRPTKDLLDGVDATWARVGKGGAAVDTALRAAARTLERDRPEHALPALVAAARALDGLPDGPRVHDARIALADVIAAAAGLYVRATSAQPMVEPGGTADVKVEVVLRRPASVRLDRLAFSGVAPTARPLAVDLGATLAVGAKQEIAQAVPIAADAPPSAPYWLAEPSLAGRQVVTDPHLVGAPSGPPALAVDVALRVDGHPLRLTVPVVYAWKDQVHGERTRRFLVAPPATVTPLRAAVMFPNGRATVAALRVRSARNDLAGEVTLGLPAGWRAEPARASLTLAKAGDATVVRFTVTPPRDATAVEVHPTFMATGHAAAGGHAWSLREDVIDYPHVPMQVVLQPATLRLVPLALRLPKGTIGYVQGSGDTVASDLTHVGLSVETLDDEMLASADLDRYAAIVVGVRAYNTRAALRNAHARLMRYVEHGGTVVVQYVTNNRLAPLDTPIGPYELGIGRDRVTDERATMTPIDPTAAVLHEPNDIGPADFDDWIQERGLYYAEKWDPRYRPIFRAADPDEPPLDGGLLVATHGKGRYVYTGLAFFRQLPAGVPGAYRLFANLLARD